MEVSFEIGDFVRLKDIKSVQLSDIWGIVRKVNVFEIVEIEKGKVKLEYIEEPISMSDIEGIPINGVDDKNIYYDPIIAASVIADGQPTPTRHSNYIYYMDNFKNNIVGDKTLKDIIDGQSFKFVHEMQHFMRKMYGSDDLRVK